MCVGCPDLSLSVSEIAWDVAALEQGRLRA